MTKIALTQSVNLARQQPHFTKLATQIHCFTKRYEPQTGGVTVLPNQHPTLRPTTGNQDFIRVKVCRCCVITVSAHETWQRFRARPADRVVAQHLKNGCQPHTARPAPSSAKINSASHLRGRKRERQEAKQHTIPRQHLTRVHDDDDRQQQSGRINYSKLKGGKDRSSEEAKLTFGCGYHRQCHGAGPFIGAASEDEKRARRPIFATSLAVELPRVGEALK